MRKLLVMILMAIFVSGATICYAKEARKPIVLKFGAWVPGKAVFAKAQDWFMIEVEKRSEGRVKFERYWAGSLAPAKELLDAVESNIADVATIMPAYYPGKLPLGTVGSLPGVWENVFEYASAYQALYKEMPELRNELARYNARFLTPAGTSQYGVLSKHKVASLADLKGIKIRAVGHQATLMKALGAVPVSMAAPEIYTAVERGTIDAVCFGPSAITAYGLQEAAKYYWTVATGGHGIFLAINDKVWNRLPADIQKLMEEVALEHPQNYHRIYQIEGDGGSLKKMRAAGIEIIQASPEVKAEIKKVAKEVIWDKWVEQQEAKGLPGRKVLDRFIELVEKYKAVSPYK